jgi:alkylation response protein AidB-like acyl-CoA dehydrogenase
MDVSSFADRIDSPSVVTLCDKLQQLAPELDFPGAWPAKQLALCAQTGVFRWFMQREDGGYGWSDADKISGYLVLSRACLTTTFVITQFMGAVTRIASSHNSTMRERWLNRLATGSAFATVGISHLTTSRRHLDAAVLRALPTTSGYLLQGYSPWVTGGAHADAIVVGATLDDGRELLAMVPTDLPGVRAYPGATLVALSASATDRVEFNSVEIPQEFVLGGPIHEVMKHGSGGGTGGLQTSTLAIGLASAAVDYLERESRVREELQSVAEEMSRQLKHLEASLIANAEGQGGCSLVELRSQANRFVLNTTQAALSAAKGAGYVSGHPAGRWCREALFFLVWSCPQPVTQAHLCELAGIG